MTLTKTGVIMSLVGSKARVVTGHLTNDTFDVIIGKLRTPLRVGSVVLLIFDKSDYVWKLAEDF
jgi:hypothetical protein